MNYCVFFLIVLCLLSQEISAGKSKKPFKIVLERCSVNKNVVNTSITNVECRVTKANRTSPYVLNFNMTVIKNLDEDNIFTLVSYEYRNNQWKESFIRLTLVFCEFISKDKWLWPLAMMYGNLPSSCPIKQGYYYLRNFKLLVDTFPNNFPVSRWKIDVCLKTKKEKKIIINGAFIFRLERQTFQQAKKPEKTN